MLKKFEQFSISKKESQELKGGMGGTSKGVNSSAFSGSLKVGGEGYSFSYQSSKFSGGGTGSLPPELGG